MVEYIILILTIGNGLSVEVTDKTFNSVRPCVKYAYYYNSVMPEDHPQVYMCVEKRKKVKV